MLNFNDVEPDKGLEPLELIPANTVARVTLKIEEGQIEIPEFGQGNFFRASATTKAKWLPIEFTITSGKHKGRKLWHKLFVDGDKIAEGGMPQAKQIGLRTMRSILESARQIRTDDMSPEANAKRQINSIEDLNGMNLCIRIGIEKGTNGYGDKNSLIAPLTPGQTDYILSDLPTEPQVQQVQQTTSNPTPDWAKQ
tara:strand:- start:2480 stop:3067 length:588 start_codon:yes stop_codon:yes gene_type:complete